MRWDPLQEHLPSRERASRLVASHSAGWVPVADLYETRDGYTLVVELPGLRLDDIDLRATPDGLTLHGARRAPQGEPASYVRVERGYGGFTRRFELPTPIDMARVTADLRDGVLTVTLPKTEASASGNIEIR